MKIVSVFNQKGGVGKTTININLASELALNGLRVLAVDIDPQGNSTSGFGIEKANLKLSSYELLTSDLEVNDLVVKSPIVENLYIVPSNIELAGAEVELVNMPNREFILKNKLKKVNNFYDYVMIDCPPSLGVLSLNALVASNSVLIPIQCEYYALEGVGELMNTIDVVKKSLNPDLYVEGVLLNMFDGRVRLNVEVANEVKKYFKEKLYDTLIPRNIRLAECPSHGVPIMLYDDKCKGADAFSKFSNEFISKSKGVVRIAK